MSEANYYYSVWRTYTYSDDSPELLASCSTFEKAEEIIETALYTQSRLDENTWVVRRDGEYISIVKEPLDILRG